ncbi:DUF2867 domain-containing protein [Fuscibacter oryzae]|uniref:DUF2867 domain-containing protein n=1 Tax=Fuscibacter oryzae TaxID=2803939 RepID=A0A8J7MPJ7_9RHOB|nr:DUF2867 domain-containing protein [Fuscibacter oryzae]MBL4926714.1 DUF2867 domain-containing protein [Fuscibacter oryzae]
MPLFAPSQLPAKCDLIAARDNLAFFDSQSITLPRPITALDGWNLQMARALPLMALASRIRDAISARFGVKRIGGFSGQRATAVQPGDHLDFFLVERSEPEVLTLTERDRHLDVMTCLTTTDGRLAITSSVITHNWFGQAYMLPVAPAHRLIVRLMLRRLAQDLAVQPAG